MQRDAECTFFLLPPKPVLRETSQALRPVSSKVRTRTRAGVSHSGFFWWVFLGVVGMVRVMLLRCRGRCYADCSSLLPPASYILGGLNNLCSPRMYIVENVKLLCVRSRNVAPPGALNIRATYLLSTLSIALNYHRVYTIWRA
jgi:hypothetical protein